MSTQLGAWLLFCGSKIYYFDSAGANLASVEAVRKHSLTVLNHGLLWPALRCPRAEWLNGHVGVLVPALVGAH